MEETEDKDSQQGPPEYLRFMVYSYRKHLVAVIENKRVFHELMNAISTMCSIFSFHFTTQLFLWIVICNSVIYLSV